MICEHNYKLALIKSKKHVKNLISDISHILKDAKVDFKLNNNGTKITIVNGNKKEIKEILDKKIKKKCGEEYYNSYKMATSISEANGKIQIRQKFK